MIGPAQLIWGRRIQLDGKSQREDGANGRVFTFIALPAMDMRDQL